MGRDHKLAVEEAGRVFDKLAQFLLFGGRKAVFRLIQQVQAVFFNALGEIQKGAFAVGMLRQIVHQPLAHVPGLGVAAGQVHRFQPVVVLHGAEVKIGIFRVQILLKQFLQLFIHARVGGPQVQHEVEHIVAGDDPASFRNFGSNLRHAQGRIILKKNGAVVPTVPAQLERLRHHIQGGSLAGAIAAVEHRHRLQVQLPHAPGGQNLEGIKAVVALPLDRKQKVKFLSVVREGEAGQIQHEKTSLCGHTLGSV